MGSGLYSADVYNSTVGLAASTGADTFAHSTHVLRSTPREEWKAHQTLDPEDIGLRESRDSDEHPTSVPIVVIFDVTGSMQTVPRQLQLELPKLLETIQLGGYVEHPQILFGAVGDAYSDQIPLQVAQFESDNRMDEHLGNIVLEGGGGGGNHESYELAFYFLARHTVHDNWEKRQQKGYAFIIGDEKSYTEVNPAHVSKVFGDDLSQAIDIAEIIKEAQETWEVFFVQPGNTGYWTDTSNETFWRDLLGQNYLRVENPAEVGEVIAKQAGAIESTH